MMKPVETQFKKGDVIEITTVENGFIIIHKIRQRPTPFVKPARRLRSVAVDELYEPDLDFDDDFIERKTKCYIAENQNDVTKLISELMKKEQPA